MPIQQRIRLLLGLAFAVAGLVFTVLAAKSPVSLKIQAQSGQNYTATWTATKVITVDSAGGFANVGILGNVPIGVAEWQVEARDASGTRLFAETWRTPTFSEITFDPANQTIAGAGFNSADWLFANHIGVFNDTPEGGRVRYKFQAPNILTPGYKYSRGNARVGGNAVQCSSNTDSNCLMPRGAYGWEVYHALSNLGSERGRITASGVMMPLKWVVSGTID